MSRAVFTTLNVHGEGVTGRTTQHADTGQQVMFQLLVEYPASADIHI